LRTLYIKSALVAHYVDGITVVESSRDKHFVKKT
jgi:hypothetical protein